MQQKQKSSKGLYLTLSILLTIQAIPFLGMMLNLLFVMAIAGIVIGILTLIYTKYDGRSKMGAIFGIVAFGMAIISGGLFHMELDYVTDATAAFILLWQVMNWFVVVAATIISYINTFKVKEPAYGLMQNHSQSAQIPSPTFSGENGNHPQQNGVFYDNLGGANQQATNNTSANIHENIQAQATNTASKPLDTQSLPPLHNFEFSKITEEPMEEKQEQKVMSKEEIADVLPTLTDEVDER